MPTLGAQNKGGNSGALFYDIYNGNVVGINSRYLPTDIYN